MMDSTLQVVGQVAGIGGLAIGLLVIIFRDVIKKNIFPSLTKRQAFILLVLIVTLSWTVALAGIGAWFYKSDENDNGKLIELLSDSNPKKIHPVINISEPIKNQLQLYPTDKVKIYTNPQHLKRVKFGGDWETFQLGQEYIVIGYSGQPIIPEFDGQGSIKMEVSILHDRDKTRELRVNNSTYEEKK